MTDPADSVETTVIPRIAWEPTLLHAPEALHAPAPQLALPADPPALERQLLGGPRRYHRRGAARSAGVSLLSARKLWRALGFASVDDSQLAFTEADVAALHRTTSLVREGILDEDTTISLARALGHTTDRLVNWQIEALLEYLARNQLDSRTEPDAESHGQPDASSGADPQVATASLTPPSTSEQVDRASVALAEIMADLEALLVYTWRRKLAGAVHRLEQADEGAGVISTDLTVGFADLVSYTRLSLRLSQRQLGALVQRFEATAADVVTAGGGQLIKTVGDEVLFTAVTPLQAAVIGLTLSERLAGDELLPEVRVGIAHGPVLRSLGDVFGPTVNLASRLTALAEPSTVATDPSTGAMLAEAGGLVLVPQRPREVSGVGIVQPMFVTRATPEAHQLNLD